MAIAQKNYNFARDGFIYLLSYATLMISSISMNFLLKGIVNHYVPDALERATFVVGGNNLTGFLAAVIIAFPIFVYVTILANRMLGQKKMLSDTGVRRWLLYVTLVVVILIIIWQLIALFIFYLNGNLVTRFLLHTLITLIISGAVLGYQWWHLVFFNRKNAKIGIGFKTFEWIVMAIVGGSVIWTFFVIDSPSTLRAKRFDDTRVNRLMSLSSSIQNFWGYDKISGHQALPTNLEQLASDTRIYMEPDGLIDPVTRQQFTYRILGEKSYELCATFETDNINDTNINSVSTPTYVGPKSAGNRSFNHPKGNFCFALEVS